MPLNAVPAPRIIRRRHYVSVDVDVGDVLEDLSGEELAEELSRRGERVSTGTDALERIYYALRSDDDRLALELMRAYVRDALGREL